MEDHLEGCSAPTHARQMDSERLGRLGEEWVGRGWKIALNLARISHNAYRLNAARNALEKHGGYELKMR